jgi:hypothetical protein
MRLNYIRDILKKFPNIASGRKNFKFFERRVKKNLLLTKQYLKKRTDFKNIII